MADDPPNARLPAAVLELSEAIASLSAERSLQPVLQRIADLAREAVGARYAALGVADAEGRILEFHTSGITPEERAAIGPLPRGHGLLGVLIREGDPVRIPDIARDPRSSGFPPNHPPMTALLGVPIWAADGRVLGDLYLTDRLDGREFDEDDERLAMLLARHAAVAIENAAKNDELERRLDQLASLRLFGEAIGGELDVERALEVAASRAAGLLGASLVAIALLEPDGRTFVFEAVSGRRGRRLLGLRAPADRSMLGVVARTREAEIVEDLANDPRVNLRVLEAAGGRTGLWAPLVTGERVVGALMALDPTGGRFGDADPRLAEAIAQQAAVAIDNARLYERARREASTSRALLRVTRALNASLRLEEILQLIVDAAAELIGTPAVAVYLLKPGSSELEIAAARALAPPPAGSPALSPANSLAGLVVGGRGPAVVAETRDRPELAFPNLRDGTTPRSVAVAPIRVAGKTLGAIEAYSTEPNHFSEDDQALLAAFADQAATAIESARLYSQAGELALLQERDRIAKELHDGIIQTIYAVGLNVDYCRLALREDPDEVERRLAEAGAGLNRAIEEIRGYIRDLTRQAGDEPDLREAVRALAGEYARSGPDRPRVTVEVDDAAATALPAGRRADVLRIVREALANASRHAGVGEVKVCAGVDQARLVLSVVDNGVGFDVAAASAEGHHGLRNMVARARGLGGHLDLRSSPGRGTSVELVVPLNPS